MTIAAIDIRATLFARNADGTETSSGCVSWVDCFCYF